MTCKPNPETWQCFGEDFELKLYKTYRKCKACAFHDFVMSCPRPGGKLLCVKVIKKRPKTVLWGIWKRIEKEPK